MNAPCDAAINPQPNLLDIVRFEHRLSEAGLYKVSLYAWSILDNGGISSDYISLAIREQIEPNFDFQRFTL